MGNLSNLYVSRSFQSLIHIATDNTASANLIGLEDGLGNPIGVSVNTAGDLSISGSFTASLQNGYVWVGNGSGKTATVGTSSFATPIPNGTISGSSQITALGFVSSSITASSLITASFDNGTRNLTFTKGDAQTFSVNIPDVSGSTINTGSFVTTSSFNAYTSSTDSRLTNIESTTASILVETQNLELFSASALVSISNLNASSASQQVSIDNLNTTTASLLVETQNLELFSASALVSISNLNAATSSYATTGSNTFIGNERIVGDLFVTSSNKIGFIRTGGAIANASLQVGDDNGNDITLTSADLNINLIGGDVKIFNNVANRGIQIEGPDPAIAFRDSTAPNNPYINLTNTNQLLQITDSTSTIVTMNTASFNIPSASFTASLAQGFTYVGDASGKTIAVSTSSFASTINTGSFVTTSSFNAYTASTDSSISQLNASSASQQISIDALNTNSASVNTSISALNTFTASQSTASLVTSINELNTFSASAKVSISNLNSFTQSQEGVNTVLAGEIDSLQAKTGSYATTGSNNFIGDQNITGNITAFSASFTYLQTIYESSSIIYSSGSNQFGDELTDVQTLSGSVKVQGSLTVNGTPVLTSSVDISGLVTTASFNAYTQSNDSKVNSLINATASYATSAITASSLVTASFSGNTLTFTKGDNSTFGVVIPDVSGSAGDFVTTSSFNAYTASNDQRVSSLEANSASVNTSITNINSATSSLFTSASLALVTASASGNTITFTKGNASTFSVTVDTGSAATTIFEVVYTGENITKGDPLYISGSQGANPIVYKADAADPNKMPVTFVSNETIAVNNTTNAIVLGLIEGINLTGYTAGQSIYVAEGGGWSLNLPSGSTSVTQLLGVVTKGGSGGKGLVLNPGPAQLPGLDSGKLWVGGVTNQPTEITTASFASSASFNTYTASNDQKVNSLISATGSYATTGSNQFNGNQTVNGFVSASNGFYSGPSTTALSIGDGSNVRFISGSNYYNVQLVPGVGDIAFSRDGVSNVKVFTLAGAAGNATTFQNNTVEFQATVGGVTMFTPLSINAGVNSNVDITGSLNVSSTFTASLQQGYVWVGNASGISTTVATSSFGGGTSINTGSFLTTGSFSGFPTPTQIVYGSLTFNLTGSSDGIGIKLENTGSDASGSMELGVTGPGNPYITLKKKTWFQIQGADDLNYIAYSASFDNGISVGPNFGSRTQMLTTSGSLYLFNPNTQRARVMTGVTASSTAKNGVNLAFNNNTNNVSLVISGSNNIYSNPGATTAGFIRYIGGNNNTFTLVPQLTGSAAFSPSMNNNIISTGMLMRLPVSSSAYVINGNVLMNPSGNGILLGTAAATHFERAVSGLNFINNIVNGNINAVASKTSLSASVGITNNNIGGALVLNMDSSSVSIANNIVQGQLTINNSYFPSTYNASSGLLGYQGGISLGTNTIFASGSNTTFPGPPRTITNTAMIGGNNVLSASLNGDNSQIHSTSLLGQGLVALGTNTRPLGASAADWGSVFVGRWNSDTGTADTTAETVFAVGTGTGASTRKTGLLIDSGSNTFVEGTLNVSGSSRFNGNTTITGSLILSSSAAIELDVIGNVSVTGSINVNSGSYNGQAVTNITPVSSSLSPVLNIVTMTSAEYALITPNSQTLYLIV
jgi:hypothetical protein